MLSFLLCVHHSHRLVNEPLYLSCVCCIFHVCAAAPAPFGLCIHTPFGLCNAFALIRMLQIGGIPIRERYTYVYLCIPMHTYAYLYPVCIAVCMFMYVCHVSVYTSMCLCIRMYIYVSMYTHVHLCVYVYACTCMNDADLWLCSMSSAPVCVVFLIWCVSSFS